MNENNMNQNNGNNQTNMMGYNGFNNGQMNGYYNQNSQMNVQNNGMTYNNGQVNPVNNMNNMNNNMNGQMNNQMYNYNNGMMQQGYNGNVQNNGGAVSLNKNVTKGLFIVLTIIYAAVMGLVVSLFSTEEELVCTYESKTGNIPYTYTYTYTFKGDKLREEHVNLKVELGAYYDMYKDDYIREAKQTFAGYVDADYDFKTSSKNQNLLIDVKGSGKSVIDYYQLESFSNLPGPDFILENIDGRYVCK